MFAKPPRPGSVKTRLAAALGDDVAADLARAMFLDTWAKLGSIDRVRRVLATTDPEPGLDFGGGELWLQGAGDLGARLERILARGIEADAAALAIGADAPHVPIEYLVEALDALEAADAALGRCEDGGFYVLGLRRCPPGLLADVRWSAPDTADRVEARLRERGLEIRQLPPWWDVDEPPDLARLDAWLRARPGELPATRRCRIG